MIIIQLKRKRDKKNRQSSHETLKKTSMYNIHAHIEERKKKNKRKIFQWKTEERDKHKHR